MPGMVELLRTSELCQWRIYPGAQSRCVTVAATQGTSLVIPEPILDGLACSGAEQTNFSWPKGNKMGSDDSSSDGGKQKVYLKSLLSTPALSIGAGSVTDTGFNWTLPTQVENPIVLSAGIPDPASLPVQDQLVFSPGRVST